MTFFPNLLVKINPDAVDLRTEYTRMIEQPDDYLTYTDVTSEVLSVQCGRGRESEFDQFSTGTASVQLLNADRQFDLGTFTSRFNDLPPNTPIKILHDNVDRTVVYPGAVIDGQLTWDVIRIDPTSSGVDTGLLFVGTSVTVDGTDVVMTTDTAGSAQLLGKRIDLSEEYEILWSAELGAGDTACQMHLLNVPNFLSYESNATYEGRWRVSFNGVTLEMYEGGLVVASQAFASDTLEVRITSNEETASVAFDYFASGSWQPLWETSADTTLTPMLPMFKAIAIDSTVRMTDFYAARRYVPVWKGQIDEWKYDFDASGLHSTIDLSCTDAFKLLNQSKLKRNPFEAVAMNPTGYNMTRHGVTPHSYLTFEDASGINLVTQSKEADLRHAYSADFGSDPITEFLSKGMTLQGAGTDQVILHGASTSDTFVIAFWHGGLADNTIVTYYQDSVLDFSAHNIPGDLGINIFLVTSNGTHRHQVEINNSAVDVLANPGFVSLVCNRDDSITRAQDAIQLYVNGTYVSPNLAGPALFDTVATDPWTDPYEPPSRAVVANGYEGKFGPFVILNYVASVDTANDRHQIVDALYEAGRNGWSGDTPRKRMHRILDLVGWPDGYRDIEDASYILGPARLDERTALTVLQQIAATAQGRLYVDAGGVVTFTSHAHDIIAADETPEIALVDSRLDYEAEFGVSNTNRYEFLDGTLRVSMGGAYLFDTVSVSRDGGVTQTATNTEWPTNTKSLTGLAYADDEQSLALAQSILFNYSDLKERVDSVTITMRNTADVLGLLDTVMGALARVVFNPNSFEAVYMVTEDGRFVVTETGEFILLADLLGISRVLLQRLELIRHHITPDRWDVTISIVPADEHSYMIMDTDNPSTFGLGVGVLY